MSRQAGLDPHHFQRLFRRWAGISPKRFGQFLTLDYARAQLDASASILDAAYDAGLSGPSRLHDLFVTYEAMSPGAFKRGGDGVDIAWGVHPSPFGPCFVGRTERGICALGFADGDADSDIQAVRAEFERRWPAARFHEDAHATAPVAARIFQARSAGGFQPRSAGGDAVRLAVCGTNFQLKVWEALLRIPPGRITSYQALAPSARAAAQRACGRRRRRRQPDLLAHSLPPGDPAHGPLLQLRVGAQPQARDAGLGGGPFRPGGAGRLSTSRGQV